MKTKKELKEEYKQKKPIAGVFQVLNTENRKVLIVEATNVYSKWNRLRSELRFGSHRDKQLQADWSRMGEDNFEFSVVAELQLKEDDLFDLRGELKLLHEMVEEDMNIIPDLKY